MEQHDGTVVEAAIRHSGYTFKKLADDLGISRNTLYNRLKRKKLSIKFIQSVGNSIHYDFSDDFPALKKEGLDFTQSAADCSELRKKYTRLLEGYNQFLLLLTKIITKNSSLVAEEEINQLMM